MPASPFAVPGPIPPPPAFPIRYRLLYRLLYRILSRLRSTPFLLCALTLAWGNTYRPNTGQVALRRGYCG